MGLTEATAKLTGLSAPAGAYEALLLVEAAIPPSDVGERIAPEGRHLNSPR